MRRTGAVGGAGTGAPTALGLAALNQIESAIFVVDAEARILLANASARQLCAEGLLLADGDGRLVSPTHDDPLQQMLARATQPGLARGGALLLRHESSGEHLHVVVNPLGQDEPAVGGQTLAFVAAVPSNTRRHHVDPLMQSLYRLTFAEARCARLIAEGLRPADVARRLHVSVQTVRSQLKAVYAKTGIHGQVALSRLVAQLASVSGPAQRHECGGDGDGD